MQGTPACRVPGAPSPPAPGPGPRAGPPVPRWRLLTWGDGLESLSGVVRPLHLEGRRSEEGQEGRAEAVGAREPSLGPPPWRAHRWRVCSASFAPQAVLLPSD